jgi:signal transduction histidine kinase
MRDVLLILLTALSAALLVAVPALIVLRLLRKRSSSITWHVVVVLLATVLSVLLGVVAVARGMFINSHDLRVLFIVVSMSGAVSLAIAVWLGRRMAAEAMWAAEAQERERQLEASRRELVAWVSHDLRTPLAGIRAMAEALEDGVVADDGTVREYHRRIRTEADRMASLVDDLFELSRIQAGALRLTMARVSLSDVVSDAVASATPLAATKNVRLLAAGETDWPAVLGSEPELARVVANLLRNAIRYTPNDGTVQVDGGRDGEGAWFSVTDSCGGIPEHDLPRVFDVAFRGESARTPKNEAGGGLGLAIVRGLVEAHRGDVAVSNVAGGCRFVVRIPAVI